MSFNLSIYNKMAFVSLSHQTIIFQAVKSYIWVRFLRNSKWDFFLNKSLNIGEYFMLFNIAYKTWVLHFSSMNFGQFWIPCYLTEVWNRKTHLCFLYLVSVLKLVNIKTFFKSEVYSNTHILDLSHAWIIFKWMKSICCS